MRRHYYNAPLLRGTTQITETAYLTDAFTREAVSFINRHATEPFFLYLAYNAVHTPFDTPPQNYMDRVANIPNQNRRVYAAMATALDDGVGQVLQALQGQNLLSNTLIFFLSDNGAKITANRARNLSPSRLQIRCARGWYSCAFRCPVDGAVAG